MKHHDKSSILRVTAALLLTAVLMPCALTGCSSDQEKQESTKTSAESSHTGDSENDVGNTFSGDGVKLTLNKISKRSLIPSDSNTTAVPQSGNTFLYAEFSLESTQKEAVEFLSMNSLSPSADGYAVALGQYIGLFMPEVNGIQNMLTSSGIMVPSEGAVKGFLAFEVPEDFSTCEICFGGDRGTFGVFHYQNPDGTGHEADKPAHLAEKEVDYLSFALLSSEAVKAESCGLPAPQNGSHYVSVTMEIKNQSEITHDFNMNHFYVLRDDVPVYPALQRSYLDYIAPGKTLRDTIIIEIPADAKTCPLHYGETLVSGNELFDIAAESYTVSKVSE